MLQSTVAFRLLDDSVVTRDSYSGSFHQYLALFVQLHRIKDPPRSIDFRQRMRLRSRKVLLKLLDFSNALLILRQRISSSVIIFSNLLHSIGRLLRIIHSIKQFSSELGFFLFRTVLSSNDQRLDGGSLVFSFLSFKN